MYTGTSTQALEEFHAIQLRPTIIPRNSGIFVRLGSRRNSRRASRSLRESWIGAGRDIGVVVLIGSAEVGGPYHAGPARGMTWSKARGFPDDAGGRPCRGDPANSSADARSKYADWWPARWSRPAVRPATPSPAGGGPHPAASRCGGAMESGSGTR